MFCFYTCRSHYKKLYLDATLGSIVAVPILLCAYYCMLVSPKHTLLLGKSATQLLHEGPFIGRREREKKTSRTWLDSNPLPLGFKQHCVQLILLAGVRFLCFNNLGILPSNFFNKIPDKRSIKYFVVCFSKLAS